MDSTVLFSTALVIGGALGALNAWLGWNKTPGEPFDVKKFISGLVTGIGAGLVLVLANQQNIISAVDQNAFVALMVAIGLAILKVDNLRTEITSAIRGKQPTP